jgi:hypothetical protein
MVHGSTPTTPSPFDRVWTDPSPGPEVAYARKYLDLLIRAHEQMRKRDLAGATVTLQRSYSMLTPDYQEHIPFDRYLDSFKTCGLDKIVQIDALDDGNFIFDMLPEDRGVFFEVVGDCRSKY